MVEVLEKMFFIEAPDAPVCAVVASDLAVRVEIAFEGDPPGVFRMSLAYAAAALIAADFLGEDADSVTAHQVNDVAKELANMICGAVLSRIESSASFRLYAPDLLGPDALSSTVLKGPACAVETGNGILTAGIAMGIRECSLTARSAS